MLDCYNLLYLEYHCIIELATCIHTSSTALTGALKLTSFSTTEA